jgi:hypothetical protein
MLVSGTQDRGFAPDRSRRIFPARKIHSMPFFGGEVKKCVPFPSFGACKRTITGQIPLLTSFASGVRCVSGQYAASSGGEGGKFLVARVQYSPIPEKQSTRYEQMKH